MIESVRSTLRERIARGATLDEIESLIRMTHGLTERERGSLWAYAWRWRPDPRRDAQIAATRSFIRRRPQPLH